MNNKVRKDIFERLKKMSDKDSASKAIYEKLIALAVYKNSRKLLCYISTPQEVGTADIIENALKNKKSVGVPITKEELSFVAISKDTQYIRGAFGIFEPKGGREMTEFDTVIVPMVAFDEKCNRLGHGKGYYDRYLRDKNCYKIGIAFAEQEAMFEVHSHDICMDMIITQDKIFVK